MIFKALLVFTLSATLSVPWALWSKAVADLKPLRAGLADMAILAFGGITFINYVDDHRLLPVVIFGGGVGTYVTTWNLRRKSKSVLDQLTEETERLGLYADEI